MCGEAVCVCELCGRRKEAGGGGRECTTKNKNSTQRSGEQLFQRPNVGLNIQTIKHEDSQWHFTTKNDSVDVCLEMGCAPKIASFIEKMVICQWVYEYFQTNPCNYLYCIQMI